MIGSTIVMPLLRNSRSFASCVAPSRFESVEYAFSALILYAKPGARHVLGHLLAAAELVDELLIEPRLVDLEIRIREQPVAIEALDVVSLERAAIAPDVDLVFFHRDDEHRAGDGAADRRGVEVGNARGGDVERAALQRREPFGDELRAAVDQPRLLGAVLERALRNARRSWFRQAGPGSPCRRTEWRPWRASSAARRWYRARPRRRCRPFDLQERSGEW